MGMGRIWKIPVSLGLSAAILLQGTTGTALWMNAGNWNVAAASLKLSLQSVTVTDTELQAADYQVTLSVTTSGTLCYVDCGFQLGEVTFVEADGVQGLCYAVESDGTVWMSIAGSDNLDAGEIATLTVQLPEDAQAGDVYSVQTVGEDASGTAFTYGRRNENGKVETGTYTCVSATISVEKGTAAITTTPETTTSTTTTTTTTVSSSTATSASKTETETTTSISQAETTTGFSDSSQSSTTGTVTATTASTTSLGTSSSTHKNTTTSVSQSKTTQTASATVVSTVTTATESDTSATVESSTLTTSTTASNMTTAEASETTTTDEDVFYGDINLDQKVNLSDAVLLSKACNDSVVLSTIAWLNGDCNANGITDGADLIVLLQFLVSILGTLPYES